MTIPSTMTAIEVPTLDGPGAMRVVERPVRAPQPGEVLLKILAAGVNFADTMQTRGTYVGGPAAPYVAGFEVCGDVVARGDDQGPHPIGARVMGYAPGAFAEYVTASAWALQPVPQGWTPAAAAAGGISWSTAYAAIRVVGDVQPGQWVLVHAAAGSVGQAAVQLAKRLGARVIATASTADKLALVERLGADGLVNYTTSDFVAEVKRATGGRGVDVVLESVGGEVFRKSLEVTVPYGKIIVFGVSSGERAAIDNIELLFRYPVQLIGLNMAIQAAAMAARMPPLGRLVQEGIIRPDEPTAHPLVRAAEVLSLLEARQTTGKHVLVP